MGNCHVQTCIFGLDVRIVGSRGSCRNPDLKISHWTNHYPVTDFVGRKKDAGDNKKKIVIAALVIAAFLQMDYVLSIVVVLVPLILVHIREYVKKDDYRKGIWCLLFLCSVCAILYVFCSIKGIPL